MKQVLVFCALLCLSNSLFGQTLQDDFSDGDFTSNPTWTGTTADFIVATGVLQTNNSGVSDTSYLSTAAAIQDSTVWEFFVELNFNPSNNNNARIYLQSDNVIPHATNNGYYLRLGENGSADAIKIYRVDGGAETQVFAGTAGTIATSPTAAIRVVRNSVGVWEVFADYAGGTNYVSEGTFTDATHTTGSHFGLWAKYTTTNGSNFNFDNILVSPLVVDVTPPAINSVTVINATSVDVLFDEAVDLTTANNAANYTVNNGVTVTNAARDASNFNLVHLTTSALTSTVVNTLTVNNVEDLNGNAINNATDNFIYYNIQPVVFQDIIINEIHADPSPQVGLPNGEYVELLNRSNKVIDLGSMLLNDGSDRVLPSFLLLPDSMVILTASANVSAYTSFGTTLNIGSLALTNGGELLRFKASNGTVIDSVDYDISWYQDAVKDNGGWSLELINPNLVCQGSTNWIASTNTNGGTPGAQNSVYNNTPDTQGPTLSMVTVVDATHIQLTFNETLGANANLAGNYAVSGLTVTNAVFTAPNIVTLTLGGNMVDQTTYTVTVNALTDCSGNAVASNTNDTFTYYEVQPAAYQDLIITEIFADPTPSVGLPPVEYVEIFNRSNKTLDLANYILFESSNHLLPSQLMLPGTYAIVCANSNASNFTNFGTVVPINSLSLTNGGELLMLRNAGGTLLDSVEYSSDWYQDAVKDDGGWSLELVNPNLLCKGGANWRASIQNIGGTPGSQNSVYDNTMDVTAPSVVATRQYGPNQILIEFDDVLNKNIAGLSTSYAVDNGATVITVVCLSNTEVILTLGTNMVDQTLYTITLQNLEDCVGNSMGVVTTSMTYYEAGAANHYDIIINEIMADPNPPVGLPEKEYIELYNRSNKTFNLEGFTFTDASSVVSVLPFFILHPGEYVTVYSNADTIGYAFFGNVAPVATFPDLNTSDELVLADQSGEIIDAVAYELSWYQNSSKDDGGWSLERINPDRPCEAASNWRASENLLGGTPCQANSILDAVPDAQAPDALRAFPLGPDSIRVYFSEAMDDLAAIATANYTIDNGLAIVSATLEMPLYNSVILKLDQPLVLGTTYTITMQVGLTDCVGNPIALKNTVRVALSQDIQSGDLILNEILFNPVTGGSDFVEIYNTSNKVLNAAELVLSNAEVVDGNLANASSLQTNTVTVDWLIFPNEYLVISEDIDQVRAQYQTENPEHFIENNLPTYDDKEGNVFLYATYDSAYVDSLGNPQTAYLVKVLDLFDYSEAFHSPLIDDKNGVSLERIDFDAPTNDANNWHSAATTIGYATPAYQNSSFMMNDIVGNDLIELPTDILSPDGDGYEDFLLINYNVDDIGYVATINVYDASGRLVRNLVNGELLMREGSLQWDGTNNQGGKARVGIHILSIEIFHPNGSVKHFKKTCVVAGRME